MKTDDAGLAMLDAQLENLEKEKRDLDVKISKLHKLKGFLRSSGDGAEFFPLILSMAKKLKTGATKRNEQGIPTELAKNASPMDICDFMLATAGHAMTAQEVFKAAQAAGRRSLTYVQVKKALDNGLQREHYMGVGKGLYALPGTGAKKLASLIQEETRGRKAGTPYKTVEERQQDAKVFLHQHEPATSTQVAAALGISRTTYLIRKVLKPIAVRDKDGFWRLKGRGVAKSRRAHKARTTAQPTNNNGNEPDLDYGFVRGLDLSNMESPLAAIQKILNAYGQPMTAKQVFTALKRSNYNNPKTTYDAVGVGLRQAETGKSDMYKNLGIVGLPGKYKSRKVWTTKDVIQAQRSQQEHA